MKVQTELRDLVTSGQLETGYRIELIRIVASPPSTVLGQIEVYLRIRQKLQDIVPRRPGSLTAFEEGFRVEFKSRPNLAMVGRHYDRMELGWGSENEELRPYFRGELTIRPASSRAELNLKGVRGSPLDGSPRRLLDQLAEVLARNSKLLKPDA